MDGSLQISFPCKHRSLRCRVSSRWVTAAFASKDSLTTECEETHCSSDRGHHQLARCKRGRQLADIELAVPGGCLFHSLKESWLRGDCQLLGMRNMASLARDPHARPARSSRAIRFGPLSGEQSEPPKVRQDGKSKEQEATRGSWHRY